MISNLISSFNKKLQTVEFTKPCRRTATPKKTTYVYRDELCKKKQPPPPQIKKVKKRVRFAETEPVIISIKGEEEDDAESEQRKGFGDQKSSVEEEPGKVVRITVKMTKQEACRMLSRCSNGGVLEFRDVASELMQIPAARVSSAMAAS